MRIASVLVVALSLGACVAVAKEACPGKLRITFFDFPIPPLLNGTGASFEAVPGDAIEWVHAALKQLGCTATPTLTRRPVKRALQELEYGETDFVMFSTPTPERLRIVEFPRAGGVVNPHMAYFISTTSLWVRKGEKHVQWNGLQLTAPPGFKVGVGIGTRNESIARERGWDVDPAFTGLQTVEKLLVGRMPVILMSDTVVYGLPDDKEARLEQLRPPLETTHYYSAASKPFMASYPAFVHGYWRALCKVARRHSTLPEAKSDSACK